MTDLTSADLATAFTFARSEAARYRNAGGALVTAAAGAARFDHDEAGVARGLLVTAGVDLGGGDRVAIRSAALPTDLLSDAPTASDCTILHRFDAGSGPVRRAWYSRNPLATINALLRHAGHHAEQGVVAGFLPPVASAEGGVVRYRGQAWALPGLIAAGAGVLADGGDRPVIEAGAMPG